MASRHPWKAGGDGVEYQYERVSINIPNTDSRRAPWEVGILSLPCVHYFGLNGCVQSRQDESIEPALAPKTFDSDRLDNGLDGIPVEYAGSVLSRGWYEARQWVVDKYYDKNFKFMLILLLLVIAFGTANRVIYKIQLYSRPSLLVGWPLACVRACVRFNSLC